VFGRLVFRHTLSASSGANMVREEARRTLLREYDRWAKDHPDDAAKMGGVLFFTYLQKERSDLLDFHAVGGEQVGNCPRLALLHRTGERLGSVARPTVGSRDR
jgi:hypothetical protein